MKLLKITREFRVDSEEEAKQAIDNATIEADANNYSIAASGYVYKSKKSKGEIIDEAWVVKIVEAHESLWD